MLSREQAAKNWAYNLSRLREKAGISKYELAKRAGMISDNAKSTVNTRAVSQFEDRGKTCVHHHLANIAAVLEVTIDELLTSPAPKGFKFPPPRRKKRGRGGKEAA